jgi:dihydrofolate reductase
VRELVLRVSMSADGFMGAPDGDVAWVFPSLSADAVDWQVQTLAEAGVHAMGRVTYADMAAHWPTSGEPWAAPMNTIPKVVFARTPIDVPWGETSVATGELTAEVRRLTGQDGRYVLAHGGTRFFRALTAADLVDEYRLLVHPIVLGAGLPVFGGRRDLRLVSSRTFAGGTAALVYRRA